MGRQRQEKNINQQYAIPEHPIQIIISKDNENNMNLSGDIV
jgi:hypothetical protein